MDLTTTGIIVFFSVVSVSMQQTCTYHEGPSGGINSPVIYSHTTGRYHYECYYIGPEFATCNGTCDSFKTLPHPYNLTSMVERCECCEAREVIQTDQIFYCEATLVDSGRIFWSEKFEGPYYTFKDCRCNGNSPDRRNKNNKLKFFTRDGKQCRTETNTIFTSECNREGKVTICRATTRPKLVADKEQKYWKQFYFDTQNGTARDFYPLENPEDIVFETYTPSQPWILPDNIFRKPQCPQGSSGQQRNMANPVTLVLLAFLSISQFSAPLILKSSI